MSYRSFGGYPSPINDGYDSDIDSPGADMLPPPTITSVTVNADGDKITFNFSEDVTGTSGFVVEIVGVGVTLSYDSGDGTSALVFNFVGDRAFEDEYVAWEYASGSIVSVATSTPLQHTSGAATNNSALVIPELLSASLDGTTFRLTLTFNVDTKINTPNGFTLVLGGGSTVNTNSIISGNETDTVVMDWNTTNIVQGVSVQLLVSAGTFGSAGLLPPRNNAYISNFSVTNNTVTPPTLVSSRILSDGVTLEAVFSKAVTHNTNATIQAPSTPQTATYASGDGTTTLLYTTAIIKSGETVTLTDLEVTDVHANTLTYSGSFSVTNESTQTNPTVSSSSINDTGNVLTVNLSASCTTDGTGFALSTGETLTYISGTTALLFSISPRVIQGASPTLAYTPGNVTAANTLTMAAFSGASITNDSDVTTPTFVSASIDATGTVLSITYSEAVVDSGATYSLSTGQTVTYASGNGTSTLMYNLSAAVLGSDTPTIALSSGTIESVAYSVAVAPYGAQSITNNSQLPVPTLTSIVYDSGSTTVTFTFSSNISTAMGGALTGLDFRINGTPATTNTWNISSNTASMFVTESVIVSDTIDGVYAPGNLIGQYGAAVASFGPTTASYV